jgi:hypothetical protein
MYQLLNKYDTLFPHEPPKDSGVYNFLVISTGAYSMELFPLFPNSVK